MAENRTDTLRIAAVPAWMGTPGRVHATAQFGIGLVVLSGLIFALTWGLAAREGVDLKTLTRDAATSSGGVFYGGYLSNLGMVFWGIASTACLFTGLFLRHVRYSYSFVLATGLLTFMLYLDDLFLIHDGLAPVTIHRGDKTLFLFYGICAMAWLWCFRTTIRTTAWLSLALSIFCFTTALIFDVEIFQLSGPLHYVFEDGFKLLGIAAWTGYVLPVCWRAMDFAMRLKGDRA